MLFTGKAQQYVYGDGYAITGKPDRNIIDHSFYYHINDEWIVKEDTFVNFYIEESFATDTIKIFSSPLSFNRDGMYCWYVPDSRDSYQGKKLKKYLRKKPHDSLNYTIRTPLYEGKTWKGVTYDMKIGTYRCLKLDTVISTGLGDLHAICIQAISLMEDQKDYQVIDIFTDYYSPQVGKIGFVFNTVMYIKDSGNIVPAGSVEAYLNKVWWDN